MSDVLSEKCCARCAHSRPIPDPRNLRIMYRCKAGPPTAQAVPIEGLDRQVLGIRIEAHWPVLAATEECDAFLAASIKG